MGRARDIANVLSSSTNIALDSELGLSLITPTSVDTTGGSGSIGTTGAVSFTSASAISLNGCFSSTYDNYRIIINANGSIISATSQSMRLRVSGADNSSSNYRWSSCYIFDNTASPTVSGAGSNGLTTSFLVGSNSSTAGYTGVTVLDIGNPFATKNTSYVSHSTAFDQNGPRGEYLSLGGSMSVTTSYTGFTIIPSTGTMTGTIKVYGYRN